MSITGPTYLYSGPGAWDISVNQTEEMLQKFIDSRGIKRVETLEDIDPASQFIVIPGGVASTMSYSPKKIKDFVFKKGRFLGICAGGILASSEIISRKTTSLDSKEIAAYEDLKGSDLFIGLSAKSTAPFIVNHLNPLNPKNLCSVNVYSTETPSIGYKAFHYSGPAFLESQDPNIKVLLRYKHSLNLQKVTRSYPQGNLKYELTGEKLFVENPIAALSLSYGSGLAVLTGVHPEMNPASFPKNSKFEFPSELTSYETNRQNFIDKIFEELSIKKL